MEISNIKDEKKLTRHEISRQLNNWSIIGPGVNLEVGKFIIKLVEVSVYSLFLFLLPSYDQFRGDEFFYY